MSEINSSWMSLRCYAFVIALALLLLHRCGAQGDDELKDAILTKESPPTFPPDSLASPPPSLVPSQFPANLAASMSNASQISLEGRKGCSFGRDIICFQATQDDVDTYMAMTSIDEMEDRLARNGLVSYRPLIRGAADFWNSTNEKQPGWVGFSVQKETEKFEVRALAVGVVIHALDNIDSYHGSFDATLKIYFFNITRKFTTMERAVNFVYRTDSRTTSKRSPYLRLNEEVNPGAWSGGRTAEGDMVRPDGFCSSQALSSIKPINGSEFEMDTLRLPNINARIFPTPVLDSDGNLNWIEIPRVSFKYKPHNRQFFPVQTDILDIFIEMRTTSLIHEDQNIVKHLLCFHPAYSGFATHVFGSDADAGHTTSDSLSMVPYIMFDRNEPWFDDDLFHFHYGKERQRAQIGNGSHIERMLGLRIIVDNPPSKGWFAILPILFVSLTAIANFVSSNPKDIGATTMVQALLGVNSLVTQTTLYLGPSTVMGQSLLLAYGINGLWILTVVLMMLINGNEDKTKWWCKHQSKIFSYLLLAATSFCLIFIPLLTAYRIDKSNGNQTRVEWAWGLTIALIVTVFVVKIMLDCKIIKRKRKQNKTDAIKAIADVQLFRRKPVDEWDQEEVIRWVHVGSMQRASYFTEDKRSEIAQKLQSACVDGDLLSRFGSDIDKLVQFVGLPFGDAVKLAEEVKLISSPAAKSDALETALTVAVTN